MKHKKSKPHKGNQKSNEADRAADNDFDKRMLRSREPETVDYEHPPGENKKAREHKKPLTRFESLTLKAGYLGILVALFTGGAILWQVIVGRESIPLLQGQLTEMQRQTEVSERPWLSVQIKPQVLNFVNGQQAVLGLNISLTNVGKSIAKDIGIDVKLLPANPGVPVAVDAAENQRKLCEPPQPSSAIPFDLFPTDKPAEQVMDISVLPKDVAAQSVHAAYPGQQPRIYVGFYVVGCVNYHSSFDKKLRQTRFAYHLLGPNLPRNGRIPTASNGTFLIQGFEVGTNIAGDKISLMQELFARNDAN